MRVSREGRERVQVWMGRVRRGGEGSGEAWCEYTAWLSVHVWSADDDGSRMTCSVV